MFCGVNDSNFNELYEWLRQNKQTSIGNFLTKNGTKLSEITQNGNLKETTVKAVSNVNTLSGVIYIPVTDEQLKRFVYNVATILDGGFAAIEGVYYGEDLVNDDVEDMIKVSDISTEKGEKIVW